MPLTPVAISNDWKAFDNTEIITYYRRTATQPATFDSGTIVNNALRRVADKHELATLGVQLAVRSLIWHLPQNQVGLPNPKVNDVIQDSSGTRWSVLRVEFDDFVTRFRVTTIQERTVGT
jgi:sugar lactone lactonase YvrE